MNRSELTTRSDALQAELDDPAFRTEWQRTLVARYVATQVIAYRVANELSQRQLAEQLGMKQPQIARIERGDHNPTLETLARICRALDMEISITINGAGDQAVRNEDTANTKAWATGCGDFGQLVSIFGRWANPSDVQPPSSETILWQDGDVVRASPKRVPRRPKTPVK